MPFGMNPNFTEVIIFKTAGVTEDLIYGAIYNCLKIEDSKR